MKEQTVTAVIVAAGSGRRMGGAAKPFLPLGGRPVLSWVLEAFRQCPQVAEIVIVTRPEEEEKALRIAKDCGVKVRVCAGGATRQLSVRAGAKDAAGGYLAIHDGARPLVTPACIARVFEAAFACGAAAAAVPVKDTIKEVDHEGFVVRTPERARLFAVQTPQVFEKNLLADAFEAAEAAGRDYSDDCQLIEAVGGKVRLVPGDDSNLKITVPGDLAVAEALMRKRGERI